MFHYIHYFIVLLLISCCLSSPCFCGELAIFCSGELEYDYGYLGDRNLCWREFVVPESGHYILWPVWSLLGGEEKLPPDEVDVLNWLWTKYSTISFDSVFVQISEQQDCAGLRHVEALCVALHEGEQVIRLYDKSLPLKVTKFKFPRLDFYPDFFKQLAKFSHLRHLELYQFYADNEVFPEVSALSNLEYLGLPHDVNHVHFEHITGLKHLKFINASGIRINEKALRHLTKLPKLRILDTRRTRLEAGALAELKACKTLETLLLSESNVSDENLKGLAGLETLEYLTLHKTRVTDQGLKALGQLKNLRYISLYGTQTSYRGREALVNACPALRIDLEQLQSLSEFLLDRTYFLAWMGKRPSQFDLSWSYSIGAQKNLKDPIEALKWYLVMQALETTENKNTKYETPLDKEMKKIMEQLDEREIQEAHRRARVYLYLHKYSSFNFEPEPKEGLPLYQYGFVILN